MVVPALSRLHAFRARCGVVARRYFASLLGVVAVAALLVAFAVLVLAPPSTGVAQPAPRGEAGDNEAWSAFVEALRAYEDAPHDADAAQAVITHGERWLRGPGRPDRRLDTLRMVLEVCRNHGEDERIVVLATRFLREMTGELQIWLLEHKAGALARLGRDDEATGLIAHLRSIRDSRRLQAAAQRAIWSIERQQRLRPGDPPPNFSLHRLDNLDNDDDQAEPLTLESFAGRGCVLVFWESWHPASRILLRTELVRWPQPGADSDDDDDTATPRLVLISREPAEVQRAFRDVHEYPWLFLIDKDEAAFDAYRIRGLPYLVELDAQGNVVRTGDAIAGVIRAGFEASQENENENDEE